MHDTIIVGGGHNALVTAFYLAKAGRKPLVLERRGVKFAHPDPRLIALSRDGRAIALSTDVRRSVEAIRPFSAKDATRYPEFCDTLARLGSFLAHLLEMTPPSIDAPSTGEMWELLKTGRRFRGLGKKDAF